MVCFGKKPEILNSFFCLWGIFHFFKGILALSILVIWIKSTHSSPLIPKMSVFTLVICSNTSNLPWFMDLTFQVPMQYICSLQHQSFTTRNIHNWALFCLWLCLFILPGAISPLFFSSLLDTYQPGEFIFQCYIFLHFHTVYGVLKARMLKWFAIPFFSGPHFVRTLHHDSFFLGDHTQHGP